VIPPLAVARLTLRLFLPFPTAPNGFPDQKRDYAHRKRGEEIHISIRKTNC